MNFRLSRRKSSEEITSRMVNLSCGRKEGRGERRRRRRKRRRKKKWKERKEIAHVIVNWKSVIHSDSEKSTLYMALQMGLNQSKFKQCGFQEKVRKVQGIQKRKAS